MRLLNSLLAGLFAVFAVVAGFIATAVVAAVVMLFLFVRRLFRPQGLSRPHVQNIRGNRRRSPTNDSDVIDISATEVPARNDNRSEADSHFAARFSS